MTELPVGWRRVRLGDVAQTDLGKMLDRGKVRGGEQVRYLRNQNVQWGRFDLSDVAELELLDDELDRFAVRSGDLLVCEGGEIGRCAIWPGSDSYIAYQKALHRLRPEPDIVDARFLRYALEDLANRGELAKRATGSTIKHLPQVALRGLQLVLPPPDDQQRIVAVLEDHLSRLDAGSNYLDAVRRRTEVTEQALIDKLFIEVARRLEWRVEPLEAFATGPRGITDGPFGSNLASAHYTPSGALVIRLQNIGDGEFKDAEAFISLDRYEKLKAHDVRLGDVVVASLGDALPRAAVVPDLNRPAIVKADCIRVRPDSDVDPRWLVYACRSQPAKKHAESLVKGVGRQRLGLKGVKAVPVPRAPLAEQRARLAELESDLNALRRTAAQAAREMGRAEGLRRALLDAAFAGQV